MENGRRGDYAHRPRKSPRPSRPSAHTMGLDRCTLPPSHVRGHASHVRVNGRGNLCAGHRLTVGTLINPRAYRPPSAHAMGPDRCTLPPSHVRGISSHFPIIHVQRAGQSPIPFTMRCMVKPQQAAALRCPQMMIWSVRGICTHHNPTLNARTLYHAVHDKAAAMLRLYDVPK